VFETIITPMIVVRASPEVISDPEALARMLNPVKNDDIEEEGEGGEDEEKEAVTTVQENDDVKENETQDKGQTPEVIETVSVETIPMTQ